MFFINYLNDNENNVDVLIFGIIFAGIGVVFIYLGIRKSNESNKLAHYIPADNINSIPFGIPVVANGTVTADQPLISPVTKKPCVYFSYILERETEQKDDKGMISWKWEKVGNPELQTIPFYLEDSTGRLLVQPANCEVNGLYKTEQFLQQGTIQNSVLKGIELLANAFQFGNPEKGNRERVSETTIFTGSKLNIFGIATMEGSQKFIQQNNTYPLILSPLSKDQIVGSERNNSYLYYAFGAIFVLVGLIVASFR